MTLFYDPDEFESFGLCHEGCGKEAAQGDYCRFHWQEHRCPCCAEFTETPGKLCAECAKDPEAVEANGGKV